MYSKFANLSDDQWLELLKRSIAEPVIEGVRFPAFPDEGTQVLFTSHKWGPALDEAFTFFKIVKNACASFGQPLGRDTRYLDFGVGWARITRMFLKDVQASNIYGVDVTPQILEVCKKLMPVGEYKLCHPRGTLDFAAESIDLVSAFSVFSHLSADNGKHWLKELHRIIRPGGLLVLTTLSKSYLAMCQEAATHPESSDWARDLASSVQRAYPDWKTRFSAFPKDELLYLPSGGGFDSMGPSDYGWAMVQEDYARAQWSEWFEVVEYGDHPSVMAQAYFSLRRK